MKDSNSKLVWSDDLGDLRKPKKGNTSAKNILDDVVDEKSLQLKLRRLTSGKGRVIIEITGLPDNKKWCQKFAKLLKSSLGVGGAYKKNFIEIHGEIMDKVIEIIKSKSLKWKKTGG